MQTMLDWYYTRASKAGYASEHQADGDEHVMGGTRGDVSRIVVPKDQPFLLNMRIPLENGTLQYEADFSDPQNKLQWAVSIAAIPGEDMYTVQMPAGLESGRYTLKIQSIEPSGQKKEVGIEAPFEVQIER